MILLSPTIYEYISDHTTHEMAVETLKRIYVKPTNVVFARHLISIRKQLSNETLDEHLQALKILSKDCNFEAVDATQHKEQYIRDTFIVGIQSNVIRQRLPEDNKVELTEVYDQARTLELAHKNVESYNNTDPFVNVVISSDNAQPNKWNTSGQQDQKCWNCGNGAYSRSKCPAKEVMCFTCGRKGHFSKVCRSGKLDSTNNNNQSQTSAASMQFPSIP